MNKDNKSINNSIDNSIDKPIDNSIKYPNLKPFNPNYNNHLSTSEAQERGRKGGKKSGEVRRARKTMKDTILDMLSKEISPEKMADLGIDAADLTDNTYQSAVIAAMLREAINGDTRAMTLLRDSIGEMPTLKQEVKNEIVTKEDLQTISNLKRYLTS